MPNILVMALPTIGIALALAFVLLLIGYRLEGTSLLQFRYRIGYWMLRSIWFRNLFCSVGTLAGSWGVYKFMRSAFDVSFMLGVGACALVLFVSFSYARFVDRRGY